MSTYTDIFDIRALRNITKGDFVALCKLLAVKYENKQENKYSFRPEPITEGGIEFMFNSEEAKINKWYKTVRFSRGPNRKFDWPWLKGDEIITWEDSNEIIVRQDERFGLFLKSFWGAPMFTIEELQLWEECLIQVGFERKVKYPSKKKLVSHVNTRWRI